MKITATATTEDGLTGTRYTMIDDGAEVGYLLAHTTGLILNVEVDQDRQGEGIVRVFYEHANHNINLYHIPT